MNNGEAPQPLNHLALIVHGQNLDLPQVTNGVQPGAAHDEERDRTEVQAEEVAQHVASPEVHGFWETILRHAEECNEEGMLKHQLEFLAQQLGNPDTIYADCEFYWEGRAEKIKAHRLIVSRAPALTNIDIPSHLLVPPSVRYDALAAALQILYLAKVGVQGTLTDHGALSSTELNSEDIAQLSTIFGEGWVASLPRMEDHLSQFFASQQYADACLVAGEDTVPAHSAVLCSVHFFRAVLRPGSPFRRDVDGVPLVDLSGSVSHMPDAAVKAVIQFLYSNEPAGVVEPTVAHPALVVAAHLCIAPVVAVTAAELARGVLEGMVTLEHLPTIILQAEEVQHWGLRCSCVRRLVDGYDEVVELEDFQALPEAIKDEVRLLARRVTAYGNDGVCSAAEFLAIIAEGLEEQRDRLQEAKRRKGQCLFVGGQGPGPAETDAKVEEALLRQERRIMSIQSFLDSYKALRKTWRGKEGPARASGHQLEAERAAASN